MKASMRLILGGGLMLAVLPAALAQDEGNTPPTIEIISWRVTRDGTTTTVYSRGSTGTFADISTYLHQELDEVTCTVEVLDADWEGGGTSGNENDEEVFLRFTASGFASPAPPEAPPIREADDDFFGASEEEGFRPSGSPLTVTRPIEFDIPAFEGKNQKRLRGEINYDVSWLCRFSASNERDPEDEYGVDSDWVTVLAIENPALGPPNAPPFADAGADRTVPAGFEVLLDGSRTFDNFNIGFDPDDDNVFEKDALTFTWEWISGPVRVDPVQTEPGDPTAVVTLILPGVYVYRLIVDDNVNALPSTDSVVITVVESLPEKNPPRAVIVGPAEAVAIGSIITLDGSRSSDPDGDTLTFRWQQTDELGGPLTPEQLQEAFQPLSGLDEEVSTWQALTEGTFYFRLLVDDGDFRSSARFSVQVVETATGGVSATGSGGSQGEDVSPPLSAFAPALCGAGLVPLAAVPLALGLMRRRIR